MAESSAMMHVIARIHTDFPEKFGVPRQSGLVDELRAQIVFEPPYRNPDAVRGLEGFSRTHAAASPTRSRGNFCA